MTSRFDHIDRAECDRIERNRAEAPTTVLLATIIHAHARYGEAAVRRDLEDIAIEIDGWAQAGHEVVQAEVDGVAVRVNELLGLPVTCDAADWPCRPCTRTAVPGGRKCIAHTRVVQGVTR